MAKKEVPPCPKCGTRGPVRAVGLSGDMFHCTRCGLNFDNDPDEGGDFSDRDPSARIQREERNR